MFPKSFLPARPSCGEPIKEQALDYLTSVDYADGLSDATRSWTYDAASNRKTDSKYSTGSWTCENKNRMTKSIALEACGLRKVS